MNLIDIFQSYRGYPEWKSKDKSKDKMDPAAGDQNSSIGDGEDSHLFNVLNARVRDFGELRNQGEVSIIILKCLICVLLMFLDPINKRNSARIVKVHRIK